MLNAVHLPKLLDAVQLPKQNAESCAITETNYWTLYNYRNKLLNAVQLPKKLLNAVQLPKQTTERCTIT